MDIDREKLLKIIAEELEYLTEADNFDRLLNEVNRFMPARYTDPRDRRRPASLQSRDARAREKRLSTGPHRSDLSGTPRDAEGGIDLGATPKHAFGDTPTAGPGAEKPSKLSRQAAYQRLLGLARNLRSAPGLQGPELERMVTFVDLYMRAAQKTNAEMGQVPKWLDMVTKMLYKVLGEKPPVAPEDAPTAPLAKGDAGYKPAGLGDFNPEDVRQARAMRESKARGSKNIRIRLESRHKKQ